METGSQRSVFPGGHPSKYYPGSTLLNFSDWVIEQALVATANLIFGSGGVMWRQTQASK